jgi:cytochrome P450
MLEVTHGTGLVLPVTRAVPPSRAKWHRFLHDRAVVDSAIAQLIADRRARSRTGTGTDTLGALLTATDARGAPLPDAYIRDSLMSLILAGHETTAGALSWALQLLAHDHRAQETLARELHNEPRPEYLRATVQEVLRHRPVFLFAIPRDVASPMPLHDWTYVPPVQLLVCIYLIHHDPALFAKPHEFRPERFIGDRAGASWIPWGGGRRRCPGRRLAILELETVLSIIVSRLIVRPVASAPEHPRWRSVIVIPHAGCRVTLSARPGRTSRVRPPSPGRQCGPGSSRRGG